MDVPGWLLQELAGEAVWKCIALGGAWAWKYRDDVADWYSVMSYQLTKPLRKDSFNETTSITVKVVGVMQHNPYSGEYEKVAFARRSSNGPDSSPVLRAE